jgi:hypothetical protein
MGDTIILWELASGKERGRFTGHRDRIWSLAFSPNGRLLASGSGDHTALVWDVTGISPAGRLPTRLLGPETIENLWADLGNEDGTRAYRALWMMVAAEPRSVPFLAARLRPVTSAPNDRLTRLISDLDSDQFKVRAGASRELEKLDERAELALRKALAAKPSQEVRQRLEVLLDKIQGRTLSSQELQTLRAIEVLEQIGTTEAREVLERMARGVREARLTQEAKASLKRLARQRNARP